jgi:hypothetical protein
LKTSGTFGRRCVRNITAGPTSRALARFARFDCLMLSSGGIALVEKAIEMSVTDRRALLWTGSALTLSMATSNAAFPQVPEGSSNTPAKSALPL